MGSFPVFPWSYVFTLYVSLVNSMANLEQEKLNTGLTRHLELKVKC